MITKKKLSRDNLPPLSPYRQPPPYRRSGPQDYRFHQRPVQGAHDKCTPGPRSHAQPSPAIPDGEHVLCPKEEG